MARREKPERPGFLTRLLFGLLIPVGLLGIVAGFWYWNNIQQYPINHQHQKVPGLSQRFLFQSGFVLRLLLVFPTAVGMCLRLVIRSLRQSRFALVIKGLIATALGTVMGLFLFQIIGHLLVDVLHPQ